MAPRGRKKKVGLMREDAARDAMRTYGFDDRVIKMCIKDLLEVYGEESWILIEESSYAVLLESCLEMQGKKKNEEIAEEPQQQTANEGIAEEPQEQTAQPEEENEQETGTQTDGFTAGAASVIDYASPVASPSPDASRDYAQHSVTGAKNSGCGWLSEEEETDADEDSVGDSEEMIPLTPEPLCEELEVLIREIRGEKKRKRVTRWDD